MKKSLRDLIGSKKRDIREYVELKPEEYETVEPVSESYVKVFYISGAEKLEDLRDEIYRGNTLIIEIRMIRSDRRLLDQILSILRQFAEDVNGDIAGLSEDQIIVTPSNVRVDRNKVVLPSERTFSPIQLTH